MLPAKLLAWALRLRRSPDRAPDPPTDTPSVDLEAQTSATGAPRFEYNPSSFASRLLVGIRLKNKLDTSRIVRVPFRPRYKYSLLIALLLIAAFLSPQLIPRWIGFEWASPQDLCQNKDRKLDAISVQLRNLTKLKEAHRFLEVQKANLNCMNQSAADFYYGLEKKPSRFLWPKECNSEIAKVSLTETNCVQQHANVCSTVGGFAGFLISLAGSCQQQVGPDICVETTDVDRTQALLDLEQDRDSVSNVNATKTEAEPIVATANSKIQELISRLIIQVDIAADAFILYSMIAIAVGIPLIVHKREKGSRIVGATFGLTKMSFVIVFIVILSVYDSAVIILKETDFARLFQNFLNDPCYVDPQFSKQRVALIVDACNNISHVDQQSDHVLQKMDGIYYDTRLFGFCKDDRRPLAVHPKLGAMDKLRKQYRNGDIANPGSCNSTLLNQQTSVAPEDKNVSRLRALLGSGVVAQLLLKFIVTSWLLHLVAFIEPMVLHNGKVEVWGPKAESELNEEEQRAVTRFARDKHLLPLIVFSLLLLLEIILIMYSIATTLTGAGEIAVPKGPAAAAPEKLNFTCPTSLLPL